MKIAATILLIAIASLTSCSRRGNIEAEQKICTCLIAHYKEVCATDSNYFSSQYAKDDEMLHQYCGGWPEAKEGDFIRMEGDSTVMFYHTVDCWLYDTQYITIFASDSTRAKAPAGYLHFYQVRPGVYQTDRKISLAD